MTDKHKELEVAIVGPSDMHNQALKTVAALSAPQVIRDGVGQYSVIGDFVDVKVAPQEGKTDKLDELKETWHRTRELVISVEHERDSLKARVSELDAANVKLATENVKLCDRIAELESVISGKTFDWEGKK